MATRNSAREGRATLANGVTQEKGIFPRSAAQVSATRLRDTVRAVADMLGQSMAIVTLVEHADGNDATYGMLRLVTQDHQLAGALESSAESGESLCRGDLSDLSVSVSVTQGVLRILNTPELDCPALSGVDTILQVVIDRLEEQMSSMGSEWHAGPSSPCRRSAHRDSAALLCLVVRLRGSIGSRGTDSGWLRVADRKTRPLLDRGRLRLLAVPPAAGRLQRPALGLASNG